VESLIDLLHRLSGKEAAGALNKVCLDEAKVNIRVVFLSNEINEKIISNTVGAYGESESPGSEVLREANSYLFLGTAPMTAKPGTQNAWSRWIFESPSKIIVKETPSVESNKDIVNEVKTKMESNGFVDVLVDIKQFDAMALTAIADLCLRLEEVSPYVAVLSALQETKPVSASILVESRRVLDTQPVNQSATTIRNDPFIISGMLVSLMLFLFVLVYLYCMDSVAAPTKFVTKYPARGKVFE